MNRNSRTVLKTKVLQNGNRSSSAKPDSARKSYLPKMIKSKRSNSTELPNRISLASGSRGVTPNKFSMTPIHNSHFAFPSASYSANRQSINTVRSSIGPNRNEMWPMGDQAMKTHNIDNIMFFLKEKGYKQPYTRKTLLNPTGQEFEHLFNFIYQHIDPDYRGTSSQFKTDIPKILKAVKYPVSMPKSCFSTIIPPHNWVTVLGMLNWMTNFIKSMEFFDAEEMAFGVDFDESSSATFSNEKFKDLVNIYKNEGDARSQIVHDYEAMLLNDININFDEDGLIREDLNLQAEIENLPCVEDEINKLQEQKQELKGDFNKLSLFNEKLADFVDQKEQERNNLIVQSEAKKKEKEMMLEQIMELEALKSEQNLTAVELKTKKHRASVISNEMEHVLFEGRKLKDEVWALEMEMSKLQKNLSSKVCEANGLSRELDIESPDLGSWEENALYSKQELLTLLKQRKKSLREVLFNIQNSLSTTARQKEKLEVHGHQLEIDNKNRECKMKRFEEEANHADKEAESELFVLQEKCDVISERLQLGRIQSKSARNNIHTQKKEVDELKAEYENWVLHDKEQRQKGWDLLEEARNTVEDLLEFRKQIHKEYLKRSDKIVLKYAKECLEVLEKK